MPEPRRDSSGLISIRSTADPAPGEQDGGGGAGERRRRRRGRCARRAWPTPSVTFDGDRVDRCADGAGDGQRRGGEAELVHAVGRAVGGQRVEVPHLADEQPDVRDGHLVQRLEGVVELVGPYLEAPGVGGDRGDLGAVQPVGGGERQAGARRRRRSRPSRSRRARASWPVRTSSEVAAADGGHALGGDGGLQVLRGDREAVGQLAVVCRAPGRRRAARRGRRSGRRRSRCR